MVAENGLGAELLSRCGVVSAWTDLHPCVVWVLNTLDCIILGSMDIGQEVTKQGFPLDLLDKLMVWTLFRRRPIQELYMAPDPPPPQKNKCGL